MRTRGVTGPFYAKHYKVTNGLSKSTGNYIRDKDLVFNGINYATLAYPITWSNNWEWTFEFKLLSTDRKILFGDSVLSTYVLELYPVDNEVRIFFNDTSVVWSNAPLTYNAKHTLKLVATGVNVELFINDISYGTKVIVTSANSGTYRLASSNAIEGSNFIGIIHSLTLVDIDTPANSESWVLDSGSIIREPSEGDPEDPNRDLIYTGVVGLGWT